MALAVHATVAPSAAELDARGIARLASRVGDASLVLEAAGVTFAFNTVNRIADARRVRLELRFLREWGPVRGWIERRLASLTGVVYDLSHRHEARHSRAELGARVSALFERMGGATVPDVFDWLARSPVVLEGILEMIEANVTCATVRPDLLREAAAIAVASRALPGSGLSRAVEHWLARGSSPDARTLLSSATHPGDVPASDLASACRRYAWRVASAAYTITDERIRNLSSLGLSDAEILDLTLAAAAFSALAIVESIGAAVVPEP